MRNLVVKGEGSKIVRHKMIRKEKLEFERFYVEGFSYKISW